MGEQDIRVGDTVGVINGTVVEVLYRGTVDEKVRISFPGMAGSAMLPRRFVVFVSRPLAVGVVLPSDDNRVPNGALAVWHWNDGRTPHTVSRINDRWVTIDSGMVLQSVMRSTVTILTLPPAD